MQIVDGIHLLVLGVPGKVRAVHAKVQVRRVDARHAARQAGEHVAQVRVVPRAAGVLKERALGVGAVDACAKLREN